MRIVILLAAALLTGCATAPPDKIGDACEIFKEKRGWFRAADRVERKYGTPKSLQLAIIRQESSFEQNARPARGKFLFVFPGRRPSSARGYAQALDGTWDQYIADTGNRGANRENFKDAADFVGWYTRRTTRLTGIAIDDPYRQYLAYHEGPTGFLQGTFRRKDFVKDAAARVEWVYQTYDAQLDGCERRLRRGIPFIPGI